MANYVPGTWHAKELYGYDASSKEAKDNAAHCYQTLYPLGWTRNAVAAFLGNAEAESGLNPWRWEDDEVGDAAGEGQGYGLVQWTPGGKYIQSSLAQAQDGYGPHYTGHGGTPLDGKAQCSFMHKYTAQWQGDAYGWGSWGDFYTSTNTPEELARRFLYAFEAPDDPEAKLQYRQTQARYWYNFLADVDPTGGGGSSDSHFKWWLYLPPF